MHVTLAEADWKDKPSFEAEIAAAQMNVRRATRGCDLAGRYAGHAYIYEYAQDEVDSLVAFISSEPLTYEQCKRLWEAGDLATSDKVWTGTFAEIVAQLAFASSVEEC